MSRKQDPVATENFNKLIEFRQAAYGLLGNAQDAMFELGDAILQMPHSHSLAELSLAPNFRRQWSSTYEALQDSRPDRTGLMKLYLQQFQGQGRLILAGDHTAWTRLWAESLPGRSYQHQPSAIPGRKPITIGLGYSTLAVIPEMAGSWALPLLHERIPEQKPIVTGSEQLRQVCQQLKERPITLWDSEYASANFLKATADIPADKLIRLRTNLGLEKPTPKVYGGRGPRPTHGEKFKLRDPLTWGTPDQLLEREDPDFGKITLRFWQGLRFRQALDCPMRVVLIERQQAPGTRRKPRLIWLAWVGQEPPQDWWRLYTRRYPIDHWYRFAKSRLHWTLPLLATLPQAERWSDLMPLLTWELWLARPVVEDNPLRWQKPLARLSPGRVCQSMLGLFLEIGTPALAPKPRGNSPGWPLGKPRQRRERFELVRSKQWKRIRDRQRAAKDGQKPKRGRPMNTNDAVAA
jgi:hypothetical protein